MLIIFGGLPGVGKTTIARMLAGRIKAVYLRIDTIEVALKHSVLNIKEVEDAGYVVAYALAEDNLRMGHIVVADSVNPINLTRQAWREVAHSSGKPFLEVEICCSDKTTHQMRVEGRKADIAGHELPTWEKVQGRDYHNWEHPQLRLDTAILTPEQCVDTIIASMAGIT